MISLNHTSGTASTMLSKFGTSKKNINACLNNVNLLLKKEDLINGLNTRSNSQPKHIYSDKNDSYRINRYDNCSHSFVSPQYSSDSFMSNVESYKNIDKSKFENAEFGTPKLEKLKNKSKFRISENNFRHRCQSNHES